MTKNWSCEHTLVLLLQLKLNQPFSESIFSNCQQTFWAKNLLVRFSLLHRKSFQIDLRCGKEPDKCTRTLTRSKARGGFHRENSTRAPHKLYRCKGAFSEGVEHVCKGVKEHGFSSGSRQQHLCIIWAF